MKKEEKKALVKLAKEALNSNEVCQGWKNKIYEAAPSLKPQLEVGKWYKYNGAILNYQKTREDGVIIAYGSTADGTWYSNDMFGKNTEEWDVATEKEVETALIEEAKKRGFKEGVKYSCNGVYGRKDNVICGTVKAKLWKDNHWGVHCTNNGWIFYNGKWAKPLPKTVTIGNLECTEEFLNEKLNELKQK